MPTFAQAQFTITDLNDGINGTNGVSVSSITEYYLASASSTGVTTATTGWTTTVQAMSNLKRYLWSYRRTTFSNGTTSNTTPAIIGVHLASALKATDSENTVELTNNGLEATYDSTTRTMFRPWDTLPVMYDGNLPEPHYAGYGKIYTKQVAVYVPAATYGDGAFIELLFTIPTYDTLGITAVSTIMINSQAKEFYAYERVGGRVYEGGDIQTIAIRISPQYQVAVPAFNVTVDLLIIGRS